jgi:acetyl-CoA acyltransferase
MEHSKAKSMGLPVMGLFKAFVTAGVPPEIMGIGPVPAIQKLLKQTGLKASDIGVFEINEAFAAQAVYCVRELGLNPEIVNPNGGAIALGHPLGCTGARQVATILREMKRRNARYGVCSMCIGGGMGAAALIELV